MTEDNVIANIEPLLLACVDAAFAKVETDDVRAEYPLLALRLAVLQALERLQALRSLGDAGVQILAQLNGTVTVHEDET